MRLCFSFKTVLSSTFITALLLPAVVLADSTASGEVPTKALVEKFENGFINWQSGEYIANVSAPVPAEYRGKAVNQAMGKELALRVSRALADSVFLQIVADTRVDAKNRLSQMLKSDSKIKLAGNIRGKELVDSRWVTKGNSLWLEARYRISMRGVDGVIAHVYDQAIETRPAMSPAAVKPPVKNIFKPDNNAQTIVYIDARGTGLQPALFPCIMDQQHVRLFDPAAVGKSYIVKNGVLEYVVSESKEPLSSLIDVNNAIVISSIRPTLLGWLIQTATADEATPVRKRKRRKAVKATEAEGLLRSNIIVGTEDADRLRKAQQQGKLETHPRIIVITDGTIGGTEGRLTAPDNLWAFLLTEKHQTARN